MKRIFLPLVVSLFFISITKVAASEEWFNLPTEDLTSVLKGKRISANHLRLGGQVSLQFRDDGTLYGNHSSGGSDSGKWKIEESKLCMSWRNWEYQGCGLIQRKGNEYRHLYPNGQNHLSFRIN